MLAASAQTAAASQEDTSPWRAYVRGRAAISQDQLTEAANQFRIALKADADDRLLRQRTFGLALLAGQEKLSFKLARELHSAGEQGFDTRLVLLGSAIKNKDWTAARAIRNALSAEDQLTFALPVIDAWLAMGAGDDALVPIAMDGRNPLTNSYAAEHRAFVRGALGKVDEAMAAFEPLMAGDSGRSIRLRLAAAGMLQREGRKHQALAVLAGEDPALKVARAQVASGKRLQTAVTTPAEGVAELFARLAADASRDRPTPVSLAIGRLATFLAPHNAEGWLVTASILAGDGKPEAALKALSTIPATDPFAGQATSFRIGLLQRLDRPAESLGIAQAAATRADAGVMEWSQLGDVLTQAGNHAEAAHAYGKAIELAPPSRPDWRLYLLRGGAYERLGDWDRAEPDLRRAVELAPEQATALNHLGYALIDRNLKLDEAQRLIEQASALRPNDGAITDSLGWVYYLRGNYPRAIDLLEEAVRADPAEPTINEHLGDAYWRVGRKYEARYSWRAAMVSAEQKPMLERLRRKVDFGLQAFAGVEP